MPRNTQPAPLLCVLSAGASMRPRRNAAEYSRIDFKAVPDGFASMRPRRNAAEYSLGWVWTRGSR